MMPHGMNPGRPMMAPPAPQAPPAQKMNQNPNENDSKTALNQFCQKLCQRPVTKQDIMYSCNKIGTQFQAIVKLNCIQGQQFAGEVCANPKEAEQAAAFQALKAHEGTIASLPENPPPKKKSPGGGGGGAAPGGPPGPPGSNAAMTEKVKLNAACMRIASRALQKGETIYETRQTVGGFQATVRLACLPDEWSGKVWAGKVCTTKQGAEQDAAGIAYDAIMADEKLGPMSQKTAEKPKDKERSGKGSGGGKGGKGGGKGYWKGGPATGPDLPREAVKEGVVAEVLEWKNFFGWLKPTEAVEHEAASRRSGKIYAHKKDLVGAEELTVGSKVRFNMYVDPSGLGAEKIEVL